VRWKASLRGEQRSLSHVKSTQSERVPATLGISFPTFSFPAYRTPLVLFSSGFPSPSTFQQKQKCNCDWFRFTPLCDRLTTLHCFLTQFLSLGHPLSARLAPLARFCFEFRMIYFVVICSIEICQRIKTLFMVLWLWAPAVKNCFNESWPSNNPGIWNIPEH